MANLNIDSVSPKRAHELANRMVKLKDIPFFFHGRPGIGKSEIVEQIAQENNMKLEILMLTQIDSQDLRGIQYPDPASKRMVYYPPDFLPGEDAPPTLLFLDELTGAEPRLQVSAYQLLLSRRIGNYFLPDNCYVCAAGNGPADGAIAYDMGTALASRLLHISVQAEPRSWIEWALNNNIHNSIITLIQLKGDLLEQTDSQLERGDLIGPNPRAWARASKILHSVGASNRGIAEPLVEGLVGKSAAADLFLTAEEMKDLPSPDKILAMDIKEFGKIIPKTIPSLYGLTYSLVAYASDVAMMDKAIMFLQVVAERATDLPAADCMSLGMELIMEKAIKSKQDNALMNAPAFIANFDKIKDVYSVSSNEK
jgi:MoxR-like ATPase